LFIKKPISVEITAHVEMFDFGVIVQPARRDTAGMASLASLPIESRVFPEDPQLCAN